MALLAGGESSAPSGCSGNISTRPDVRLSYSAGSLPLHIWVESSIDTTLVIEGPDGLRCDDDSGEGTDAYLTFPSPDSGTYDIWVGVYSDDDSYEGVSLVLSELDPLFGDGAYNTVRLDSGFSPDPHSVDLVAGGGSSAPSGCSGNISTRPDVRLSYSAGSLPLHIWV